MNESLIQNRPITVDSLVYDWRIIKNDVVTDVAITRQDANGQSLRVGFNYATVDTGEIAKDIEISPELLSKIIRFALKLGWEPTEPGLVDFVIYAEEVDPT